MRNFRTNYFITGAILIILGVLTMRYPLEAIMSAGVIIGIGLLASGLNYFSAFYFFGLKRFILLGLLDFVIGVYMIIQPGITAFVIPFVVGAWLLTTGLSRVGLSLWLGGARIPGWWLMLINGIVLIGLAVLMCAAPLSAAFSVMMILAGVLTASGILSVLEGCVMCR
ncbi:MAG: DUF308 domain-containing protein [Synergistaceae bacterium]|nr:DUF308 domain-containing protein [Synergistaceae bacterium]